MTVQQLLESNGIDTVLVGDSPLPNLAEEIRVAEEDAERARQLIADALAAGPAGAAPLPSSPGNPISSKGPELMILITGATGTVGSEVITALLPAQASHIRVITPEPSRTPRPPGESL